MSPQTRHGVPGWVIARLQRLDVGRFHVYGLFMLKDFQSSDSLPNLTPKVSKVISRGLVIHGRTRGNSTRPNQNLRPDLRKIKR